MKVIGAIIGWLFGLLFAVIMFLSVLVIIPISVFGQEVLNRDSATRLINAIVADETTVTSFVNDSLKGMAQSNSIEDAGTRAFVEDIANEETSAGKATRNMFDAETVSTNLVNNSDAFFDWLEGKTDFLSFNLTIGGTSDDHAKVAVSFLKNRMDTLPACTESQLGELLVSGVNLGPDITCNPGITSDTEYEKLAKEYLNDVKVRQYIREGYTIDMPAEASERAPILFLQKTSKAGIIAAWIIVAISVLFMLILFSPKGIKQMMTGIIVMLTGFTLSSMGGGALALITKQSGVDGVESIAAAFTEVIGKPIATQGSYMIALGGLLIVWGIMIVAKKGKNKSQKQSNATNEAQVATVTPVEPIDTKEEKLPDANTPAETSTTENKTKIQSATSENSESVESKN